MIVVFGLVISILPAPLAADAQAPTKVSRVGMLLYGTPETELLLPAFRQGLRDLGYTEGQNLSIDYRFAEGQPDRLPDLAAQLVRLSPDVIVALGEGIRAARRRPERSQSSCGPATIRFKRDS